MVRAIFSSVIHACERVGEDAESFSEPSLAVGYDRLILPGVGSFSDGD